MAASSRVAASRLLRGARAAPAAAAATAAAGRRAAASAAGAGTDGAASKAPGRGVSQYLTEFWHLRENMVMRNHQRVHKIANAVGHGGYIMGLLEYGVTDIIWLRLFAIGGCGFIVAYQMLQPRVQWLSAGWCAVYVSVNVYQLMTLMAAAAAPPSLSWEEERLHARFARHVTAAQFHSLMALGEWLWLVDGALLAEEGSDRPSEGRLALVAEGLCEVSVAGEVVAELGPGSAVGEIGMLTDDAATSRANVTAVGSVRCFSVPVSAVQELLEGQPELRRPLERAFASIIAGKVRSMNERLQRRNYRAVLEVACTLDEQPGISEGVAEYRRQHGVSDELHRTLLDEVPQCVHKPFQIQLQPPAVDRPPELGDNLAPVPAAAALVAASA